jgi:mannose-6-phosphate isomerase-like protein (cupin superfamily)
MSAHSYESRLGAAIPDGIAPDGSEVRILLRLAGGSMAEFSLQPGQTSIAVCHLSVEELWYVVDGSGEMWRSAGGGEGVVVDLVPGTCVSIPLGTDFQFRSFENGLRVVGVTMPPWPLDRTEAVRVASTYWESTVEAGPGLGRLGQIAL